MVPGVVDDADAEHAVVREGLHDQAPTCASPPSASNRIVITLRLPQPEAACDLLEGQHHDFESWIDWIHRTTKKKTHDSISVYWKWLCQAYSALAKQPMDCFTTEQVRRVRRVPFYEPAIEDILGADFRSLVPQRANA